MELDASAGRRAEVTGVDLFCTMTPKTVCRLWGAAPKARSPVRDRATPGFRSNPTDLASSSKLESCSSLRATGSSPAIPLAVSLCGLARSGVARLISSDKFHTVICVFNGSFPDLL